MHLLRAPLLFFLSVIIGVAALPLTPPSVHAQQQQQRLVESVDIEGNRRLRDEDILYYVQTRPGDTFNPQQVERDFQAILALGFFDKSQSSVSTVEGERGGYRVIFTVKELPIIRDIQFEGLKSVPESDVLKAFREQRIGISKEAIYDPVKARNAVRVLKELLAEKGHPNATVEPREDEVSATSTAITFVVNEGDRVRVVEIQFEGNQVFSDGSLRSQMKYVREAGLISRFKGTDILDRRKLDEDLRRVAFYMRSKGYLQARTGEPVIEGLGRRTTGFFIPLPFLSSTDEALRVTIPVVEGKVYRIGEFKIEGNSIFSEQVIRSVIGLKQGDIANGERIGKSLFEDLKKLYGSQGFIQYTAEPEPNFKDNPSNPNEGIVDFTISIDEGKQFSLRRLEFLGNTFTRDNVLRREVIINEGDIYSQAAFEYSVLRLNQLGYFEPIDKEKDVDFRTNEEEGLVDVNLKVQERGRQQISFNGGLSGIGGSFFGLEYSTNNLLGRGETLSINLAAGNRQRSFQFSFTEPYFRDRPITVGFSVFAFTQKFFGEGTFLSQNAAAQQGLFGSELDFFSVADENLFTRNSYGASFFASAPLSEFYRKRRFTQSTRVGLSYQISQTSVKDPEVNQQANSANFIPVIYSQPNILTSRLTPTFVYDTRDYSKSSTDPSGGTQISASLAVAGLLGDVRTYAPSLSYIRFFPVRNKGRDQNPDVFGFRILAAHTGSFGISDAIRNANSLAFIGGIPIYERFFLGDEFTIRGYNVRSITPVAPLDQFITTRNVVLANNRLGTPEPIPGLPSDIANLGLFTGPSGTNSLLLSRQFTSVGGDTQLLANLEYRIPIFGPVSIAAFADVGSAFNLRSSEDQSFSSNFLADQPFLGLNSLSLFALRANPTLALSPSGGLILRDNRLVTREEFNQALRVGPIDPLTSLPFGFQQAFLRGDVQTNTVVRLSESVFSKLSDYRSSIGAELRVQVPVVNVPFRLIYAYNPNARRGFLPELPGVPFNERKSVFRFSVGRTF
ncbi:MAG TPA: outer membrane protein assembly factor BamA [Pyrinomonadaceae bacterium]|jgi:outer membrane protein insertion porin family|nr:outer membrane protein assembly factor BamA [Pyrinomonadaceae bacterium]